MKRTWTMAWLLLLAGTSRMAEAACTGEFTDFYDGVDQAAVDVSCAAVYTVPVATVGLEEAARCIYQHPPLGGGACAMRWTAIQLPQVEAGGAIHFEARVGIGDTAVAPTGVIFRVRVGPMEQEIYTSQKIWIPFSMDLTSLAGTTVNIELETDTAGSSGWDHALWTDARLVMQGKRIGYGYPENGHQAIGPYGVNTHSGNLIFTVTDLSIPFNGMALTFVRTYNSQRAGTVSVFGDSGQVVGAPLGGVLGPGWTHNFELSVTPLVESSSGATYFVEQRADGRTPAYTRTLTGALVNPAGIHDTFSFSITGSATNPAELGTGIQLRQKHGVGRTYDPAGRIVRIEEPDGTALVFSWNPATRRLDSVTALSTTTPETVTLTLTYDLDGRLAKIEAPHPSGTGTIATQYLHAPVSGLLQEVIGPGGIYHAFYEYEVLGGRLIRRRDPRAPPGQKKLRYVYSPLGEVTAIQRDGGGLIGRYDYYGDNGCLTTRFTQQGRVTTWTYDGKGVLTSVRVGPDVNSLMRWDPDLNPTVFVDPNGNLETTSYDAQGNLLAATNPLGDQRTTTYEPVFNRPMGTTDERGDQSAFQYDATGNLTESVRQIAAIPVLGESATEFATRRVVNSRGLVTRVEDPDGHVTFQDYDGRGQSTRIRQVLESPSGDTELTTVFEYDLLGRRTAQTDPRGIRSEWVYDLEGRVLQVRQGIVGTDPPKAVTINEYDDATNQLTKMTDATGRFTRYTYNDLDQMIKVEDAAGIKAEHEYSLAGETLKSKDGNGHETWFSYDLAGRLTWVDQELSPGIWASVGVVYDASGNMTAITDPNGHTTQHEYDPLNRKTRTIHPDGTEERWEYDEVGNMTAFIDAMGIRTEMLTDSAGRLRKKHFTDGSTPDVTMFYSPGGETTEVRTKVNTKAGLQDYITKHRYDSVHRLTQTEIVGLATKRMGYDENGNLIRLEVDAATTPDSDLLIDKVFDALNRTTEVQYAGLTTRFEFEPGCATCGTSGSRLSKILRPNGVSTTMMYDARGRLISLRNELAKTKAALSFCEYAHDQADNRTSMRDVSGLWTYSYDSANRLKEAHHPLWSDQIFIYDPAGNRVQFHNEFTGVTDSTFTETNAIAASSQTDGTELDYTFNARGELAKVEKTLPDNTTSSATYLFDSAGRMVGGQHKTFGYDSTGQRVYETDGKAETWYLNDGITMLMELDGAKRPVVVYNPGISQTRLDQQPPLTEYMLHDGLGSVVQWTDQQGNLTQELFYEPYGRQQYSPRPDSKHLIRYIEQAHDDVLEMTYLNARWLEASLGRFLTRDEVPGELGHPQSLNRYSYVRNRPLGRRDPSGLTDCNDFSRSLAEDFARWGADDEAELNLGGYWIRMALGGFTKPYASGFRPELVAGNQRTDVYRHIYGHAGFTLMGAIGILASNLYQKWTDERQPARGGETAAEIADDKAGRQVGNATEAAIKAVRRRNLTEFHWPWSTRRVKPVEETALRARIRSILCKPEDQ